MNKKTLNFLKLLVVVVIAALFVWFVFIYPSYNFSKYEKSLEEAAKRYFDLNQTELPTGNRIATVSMQTLYHKSYLKEDFYIPYTDEPCNLKDSWVKVRKVDGEYKYYTYLQCGAIRSTVDSKGPTIKLNGSEKITVDLGEEYKDPGIKSVVDNSDGKMDVKEVTVNVSKVDTNKIGTYEVTYTAQDALKNKTVVTREVEVVSKIKNAVNVATEKKGYYTGKEPNNYLRLSGMLFRIIGVDGDNVKIVASEDIANVNYDGISSWLEDYYMKHINDEAKKILVKNKYCNMAATSENLATTECTSYTKKRYAYITSITDVNKSLVNNESFLRPGTMTWLANESDKDKAYSTRNIFFGEYSYNYVFIPENKTENYGVRPVLTVKGSTLVKSGDGTYENPYSFGETKSGKIDEKINTRYSGEYLEYAGNLWRIIEVNSDGTTKIISVENIKKNGVPVEIKYDTKSEKKIYNPKEKGNIGYQINNRMSEYIDTSYFVNKNISVPIYKKEFQYGKEQETKKYKVKLSAPNMYEMFSTIENLKNSSYWLVNSSETKYYKAVTSDVGVVISGEIGDYTKFGVRVVGNLSKSVIITKGNGTLEKPYGITK